jgi:hypothetical protein
VAVAAMMTYVKIWSSSVFTHCVFLGCCKAITSTHEVVVAIAADKVIILGAMLLKLFALALTL